MTTETGLAMIEMMDRTIDADVPLERLEAEITELSGHVAAATARLLGWISIYDKREGWKSWGCRSAAHWLSWKCGDGLHSAREKVRTGRALDDLPMLAASFARGELSYTKVRAITRVATPSDEDEWVNMAKHSTGAQLERVIAQVRAAVDRDENADARQAFERRRVTLSTRTDGLDEIKVVGPRDAIAVLWAAIEMVESLLVDDAVTGSGQTRRDVIGDRGGLTAVRFDALTEIAERVIADRPQTAERGDIGRLTLVIDADGLAEIAATGSDTEPDAGELTLSGRRIAPEVAKRWACDIRTSVILEDNGHACDEGHTTRVPNRKLRRALHRRDAGMCRFPGCATTRWLHAHHIVHWANQGPTDLANLVSLCGFHHQLVHEGQWAVAIIDRAIVWTDPNGIPATIEPLHGNTNQLIEPQLALGISPQSIESQWDGNRLDFHFVVSVLAQRIAHQHTTAEKPQRPRGDVPAVTSPRRHHPRRHD